MCKCGHGGDRHYLGYAGPGVCGGVLANCLEQGCNCQRFEPWNVILHPVNVTLTFPTVAHD